MICEELEYLFFRDGTYDIANSEDKEFAFFLVHYTEIGSHLLQCSVVKQISALADLTRIHNRQTVS